MNNLGFKLRRFKDSFLPFINKPENFFLLVGGVFVIALALANPPLQAVDEQAHFYRIVQVGKGRIFSKHIDTQNGIKRFGDFLPKSLVDETELLVRGANTPRGKYKTQLMKQFLHTGVPNQDAQIIGFDGSSVYSPVVYAPQVIGYKGSIIITKSTLLRMYAARIANGLFWLALIYLAIRLILIGKWTMAVLGLLPVNVFIASTMSADASVIAMCFLFIAYVLHLRVKNKPLAAKQLFILLGLMSLIAVAKSAYYPILLLIFLIPRRLIKAAYHGVWAFLLGLPLLLLLLWSAAVRPIAYNLHRDFFPNLTYTPDDQIHFTLSHPLSPIHAIVNTVFSGASDLTIRDLFGTFTWSRIVIPLWMQMFAFLFVVFVFCYQLGRTRLLNLDRYKKLIPGFIIIASFSLIYLTFYFVWTAPGATYIDQVQGRYFLPFLPLLIPIFTSKKIFINLKEAAFVRTVQLGTVSMLAVTLAMILRHFY